MPFIYKEVKLMLTKEQIDLINQSIINLKTLCKSMLYCGECPMKRNCSVNPNNWEVVNNGKEETT